MKTPLSSWPKGVAQPAQRALQSIGITKLEQLVNVTEAELAKLHGMGPKAIRLLKEALAALGKSFKDSH